MIDQQEYSPLNLAIKMDEIAYWIKSHKPKITPEKLGEMLHEEVYRIVDEIEADMF